MKSIILCVLIYSNLFYTFSQRVELNFYSNNLLRYSYGRCVFLKKDNLTTIKIDLFDKNDTNNIVWSESKAVNIKYLDDVKNIFEIAKNLDTTDPFCLDGILWKINVVFKDDGLSRDFDCHCPFNGLQYEFFEKSSIVMLKVFEKKKSKGYSKFIRRYIK